MSEVVSNLCSQLSIIGMFGRYVPTFTYSNIITKSLLNIPSNYCPSLPMEEMFAITKYTKLCELKPSYHG